ncbi:class C beta-lactamase-related serine hydrolase [bacterium]|nr:MAG: class C beta-lactamase-related serine hydrolase [bacterium]
MVAFGSDGQKKGGALPRSTPQGAGVRPEAIAAFVAAVNEKVGGLHSMMLLRHGKVAAEAWWKPFTPDQSHVLYSLSKSFTSTAIGLAVSEGRLKVEDKVVSFFPDKVPAEISENLAAMRVYDLLTMSTGHESEPGRNGEDWVKDFLAAPVPHKPGTHFLYNTPATHVLAAIVQKVTKRRMLDYLTPRLFEPLGIEGATWDQSPAGVDIGGYGLKLKTEDIAKFGQLFLQKGKWEGKQIVPAAWVEDATKKQVSNGDPAQANDWSQGYGYQFWRCQHGHYRGDGAFGQYCIVMPAHDAVLAITSGVGDMGAVLKAAWDHLVPGMVDGATGGASIPEQMVPLASGAKSSGLASGLSGKTWKLETNPDEIDTIKLVFEGEQGTVAVTGAKGTQEIAFGFGAWVGKGLAAGSAAWTAEDRLHLKVCLLDSPHAWEETFVFAGDALTIEDRKWNVMFGPRERPTLKGKISG